MELTGGRQRSESPAPPQAFPPVDQPKPFPFVDTFTQRRPSRCQDSDTHSLIPNLAKPRVLLSQPLLYRRLQLAQALALQVISLFRVHHLKVDPFPPRLRLARPLV